MGLGDCCWIINTMLGVDFRLRNRRRGAKDTLGKLPPIRQLTGLTRSCPQLVFKLVTSSCCEPLGAHSPETSEESRVLRGTAP